eukprot:g44940.t1
MDIISELGAMQEKSECSVVFCKRASQYSVNFNLLNSIKYRPRVLNCFSYGKVFIPQIILVNLLWTLSNANISFLSFPKPFPILKIVYGCFPHIKVHNLTLSHIDSIYHFFAHSPSLSKSFCSLPTSSTLSIPLPIRKEDVLGILRKLKIDKSPGLMGF